MQTFQHDTFVIRNEINTFANSVRPVVQMLKPLVDNGTWLAGGALLAYITGDKVVKDYDLFFASQEALDFTKNNLEAAGATSIIATENALTYLFNGYTIQLIFRKFYPTVAHVLNDFDFTICMVGMDFDDNMYFGDYTLYDIAKKRLNVHKINSIGHTMKRLVKYGSKGYSANITTYEDIAKAVGGTSAEVLVASVLSAGSNGSS